MASSTSVAANSDAIPLQLLRSHFVSPSPGYNSPSNGVSTLLDDAHLEDLFESEDLVEATAQGTTMFDNAPSSDDDMSCDSEESDDYDSC